uniref:HhH-GPD domain-containing protein n=1 Tax=Nelumbo nucifera TaxID=4432 RepID=A0A822ZRC5_NELNU|nr:TPA_asm: hypothetical protein HUJ06_017374 [Nelumbo nucifera]
MDFSKEFSVPGDIEFPNEGGSWIPVTPAKPVPTRPQPTSGNTQGNQLDRSNWLQTLGHLPALQETSISNELAACYGSMHFMDQHRSLNNWEAALAGNSRGSVRMVGTHTQALADTSACGQYVSFGNLLAFTTPASATSAGAPQHGNNNAGSSLLFPIQYSNIGRGESNSATLLLANQDLSLRSNHWNNNYPQQIPQYGFPVPYLPSYDLNALPNRTLDDTLDEVMSFSPVTPDKGNRIQNEQLSEIPSISVKERSNKEKDKALVTQNGNEPTELGGEKFPQTMLGMPSTPLVASLEENHNLNKENSHNIPEDHNHSKRSDNKLEENQNYSKGGDHRIVENHNLDKGGDDYIDLNKKPQQKPKRKKIRPKVIIEGKPKRTPKPTTPKQVSTKENPSGKRKYVRRKGLKTSDTPSETVLEINGPSLEPSVKSCKRALNFDLVDQAGAEMHSYSTSLSHQEVIFHGKDNSSCRQTLNLNSESQKQDLGIQVNNDSQTKSTVQPRQGIEATVNNTTGGIAHDLDSSVNQLIQNYFSLPENPAPTTPVPARQHPTRVNLKALARKKNDTRAASASPSTGENGHHFKHQHLHGEGTGDTVLKIGITPSNQEGVIQSTSQNGPQSILESCDHPDNGAHPLVTDTTKTRGSKREYSHTINGAHLRKINLIGTHYNSLQFYQNILHGNELQSNYGMHLPEIYKKYKTEKEPNTSTSRTSSSMVVTKDGHKHASQSNHETLGLQLNDGTQRPKIGVSKSLPKVYANCTVVEHNQPVQNISKELLSCTETECGAAIDNLETSETFDLKEKTKKRSKGPNEVHNLVSTAIPHCTQLLQDTPKTLTSGDGQRTEIFHGHQACMKALSSDNNKKSIRKRRAKKGSLNDSTSCSSTNAGWLQEQKGSLYQSLAKSAGPTAGTHTQIISIDELVHRLNDLSINGSSSTNTEKEQKALIPYTGYGTMVPYEGPRRRSRPKVDLDPETNRVWNLLMGKAVSDDIDEMDADKRKWWEKERTVFQGRADSFIHRMRLVQGDRRFSRWKGSVVDSVIGVFLTQNVSDHLSSSAFMSLAARFPLQPTNSRNTCYEDGTVVLTEKPEVCIIDSDETLKWNENLSRKPVYNQKSMMLHEAEQMEEREVANSNESFGSNMGGDSLADNSSSRQRVVQSRAAELYQGSPENRTESLARKEGSLSFAEADDRRAQEDAVSSQNSVGTSISQTTERIRSCLESNSKDLTTVHRSIGFNATTSFMELLQMAGTTRFQEFYNYGYDRLSFNLNSMDGCNQSKNMESDKKKSSMDRLASLETSFASIYQFNSLHPHTQVPIIPSSKYSLHMTPDSGVLEVECLDLLSEESRPSLPSTVSQISELNSADITSKGFGPIPDSLSETTALQNEILSAHAGPRADPNGSLSKHAVHQFSRLEPEACREKNPHSYKNKKERTETSQAERTPNAEPKKLLDELVQRQQNTIMQQVSRSTSFSGDTIDVVERTCLVGELKPMNSNTAKLNSEEQVRASGKTSSGITVGTMKDKKEKVEKKKNNAFDWDILRKETCAKHGKRERSNDTMDSVDWEAVRCADVNDIAKSIKERGMNNMLAERIKDFLNRLVRDHGSIDLEWLRDVPPDKAKEYLLSIRGLGLKSVECVRLLTLHNLAFPVDTNVGRIAVRLGWVPLQPLPESLQLHLLELYPVLETIQKYLWPRLCKLDQRTLYELHYQLITFGKVFCTKSKPNCNACPMRTECRHFASAFASARLALPGPEEKGLVSSTAPIADDQGPQMRINPVPLPLPEASPLPTTITEGNICEPIIEVPATPEPERTEVIESDIEDAFFEDPDEIPVIKLNIEEFTLNLQNYIQENKIELQDGDLSKALVALTPQAASIPVQKLKNVSRLRTEHQVICLCTGV